MDSELSCERRLLSKLFGKENKKVIIWLLLFLLTAAAFWCYFTYFKIPARVTWTPSKTISFYDGDVKLILKNRRITLNDSKEKELWKSADYLKVQDVFVTDIDGNGDMEMIALLWKRGRFGIHRPFWITEDEKSFSQHIFIYDISKEGLVSEKWFASDIGPVVNRMKQMERNPEIFLTEEASGNCSLWRWESFGLKNMDNEVKVVAFGDNIIHKEIYLYGESAGGGNYDFLYEPFREDIEDADLSAVQIETLFVDKSSAVSGYPEFGTPIGVAKAIANAGFDVASCAGNHAFDRGIYGIDVTTGFFKNAEITCLGIQGSDDKEYRPYELISRNGIRIALFDYTYGTNIELPEDLYPGAIHLLPDMMDEEGNDKLVEEIKSARNEADFVIVFVHWGTEYETVPNDYQNHFTELFGVAQVDVVIGAHPHVLQPVQMQKRPDGGQMLVYYSLGNFRANQAFSEETMVGGEAVFSLEHCYDGVRVKNYELKEIDAYWKDALEE